METWFDKDMVDKILNRFVADKKISRHDNRIYIINFSKHQSSNPSIKKWIERSINAIDKSILDSLYTACDSVWQSVVPKLKPKPNLDSNLNSNLDNTYSTEASSDFQKKEITVLIDKLIDDIKEKSRLLGVAYNKEKEREFAKHLLTAKVFWDFCEQYGRTREQMCIDIMDASIGYWKWPRTWPMQIYKDYADVISSYVANKTKKQEKKLAIY